MLQRITAGFKRPLDRQPLSRLRGRNASVILLSFYCISLVFIKSVLIKPETTFYGLDRFYINLLLKSCPRLLVLQRVAQNAKSCSKVAEHNLFMPTPYNSRELMFVNLLLIFIHEKQVVDILQKVIDSSQADRGDKDKPSSGTNT